MKPISGARLMLIGLVLLLAGVILPLLMVLRILEPSFFLSFLGYIASVSGLLLGIIGAATYRRDGRR